MPRSSTSDRPEVLPLGQNHVLVRFSLVSSLAATGATQSFRVELERSGIEGIIQIAASLSSVLVKFDPKQTTRTDVESALSDLLSKRDWLEVAFPAPQRRWLIPVAFGDELGPQLTEVSSLAGVSEAQAVTDLVGTDLRVLTIGFAPGQPYLGTLPDNWDFPRQPSLTPMVPIGALVVAVRQLVLFSTDSSTGWRQVGQTGFRPFIQSRSEPFLLRQGDAVRFVQTPSSEMHNMLSDTNDGLGGAICENLS